MKIMIVDDHVGFRQVVSTLLRKEGAGCAKCADGQEAVVRPDLVLMDIAMERLCGLQATAQSKSRFPAAGIFILTLYGGADLRDEAKLVGACGYLLEEDLTQFPGSAPNRTLRTLKCDRKRALP